MGEAVCAILRSSGLWGHAAAGGWEMTAVCLTLSVWLDSRPETPRAEVEGKRGRLPVPAWTREGLSAAVGADQSGFAQSLGLSGDLQPAGPALHLTGSPRPKGRPFRFAKCPRKGGWIPSQSRPPPFLGEGGGVQPPICC